MILEVSYEGNGVFKVWPPPRTQQEAQEISGYIKAHDPHNKSDRDSLPLIAEVEESLDELREAAGNHESRADELEERINEVLPDLKDLQHEDDMEILKSELAERTSCLEAIL
jgi:hypothetical protein